MKNSDNQDPEPARRAEDAVWLHELNETLRQRAATGVGRELVVTDTRGPWLLRNGRRLLNLASNDYLGLSRDPRLVEAAIEAAHHHGVGSGASRLVVGHSPLHAELEAEAARFKQAEAALIFPTGYMANLAVLTALADQRDLLCLDKSCHASLVDAARACGAVLRVYPHGSLDKLDRLLARGQSARRRLVVTDSVFSMEGDAADLRRLVALARQHDAILVVDEAHGTGVLGATGAGWAQACGVAGQVDVIVSTASKALGGLGGIVTARQVVIDWLVNQARSFIYTTAVPPIQAAVMLAAIRIVQQEPEPRRRLARLAGQVRAVAARRGFGVDPAQEPATPIVPLLAGKPEAALALSAHLMEHGLFAPAMRPPTVPPGRSMVRLSLRADLPDDVVEHLDAALGALRS